MKNATKKASEIIRELWDYDGKPTQEFNIDGKLIKTNFEAYDLPYWNGTDIPVKYTRENNGINYRSTKPRAEELDECIAQGFDEIRFVLCASGMIRGYCEIFVWAHRSTQKKAQEGKAMKRYLITMTGRSNTFPHSLRGVDVCDCYVFANNKNEAISKFWEQIEMNSHLSGYSRRDFKITAERWEKEADLDVNGNPLKDLEWAIPFEQLRNTRMGTRNCKWALEVITEENTKEQERISEEAHQLAQAVAQMDADQVCSIVEETLRKPQESSEPVAQENIQPEPEDATESISEPQEASPRLFKKSKRLEIPKTEIDKWNRMLRSAEGSSTCCTFTLWHEGIDEHGRWFELGFDNIRAHMISHPSDCYFIKKIKENTWLYFEDCAGIQERWLLSDVARAFFLPEPSDDESNDSRGSRKASQSSSEDEKEIINENAEELTESNPEPQRDVSLYSLGNGDKTFILVKEREENGLWAYYSVDSNELLWSSAERFSQGDLTGMYENGYFMSELVAKRKNKAEALELLEKNGAPSCLRQFVELRNSISEIDEEIARLY